MPKGRGKGRGRSGGKPDGTQGSGPGMGRKGSRRSRRPPRERPGEGRTSAPGIPPGSGGGAGTVRDGKPGARRTPRKAEGRRTVLLRDMPPGYRGNIKRLNCKGLLRRRLMDMGIVTGAPVEVEKPAPLGDPMKVKIKDCILSLRRDEAEGIEVEIDEEE